MNRLTFEARLLFVLLFTAGLLAGWTVNLAQAGHWPWVVLVLFVVVLLVAAGLAALRGYRPSVWQVQAEIMRISGQQLPDLPRMTRGSFLYLALILEEASELFDAASTVLQRQFAYRADGIVSPDAEPSPTFHLQHQLLVACNSADWELIEMSQKIRKITARLPDDFFLHVLQHEAKALLDGSTDLVVVTAGFSNSSGMPGEAAYTEVSNSNLSKADPETGLIKRDASGKWIKGPNYTPPDLDAVLVAQAGRDMP